MTTNLRHPYRPMTMRDGSKACCDCYGTPSDPVHFQIDHQFIIDVENAVERWHGAWNMVRPEELCAAVLIVAEKHRLRKCNTCGGSGLDLDQEPIDDDPPFVCPACEGNQK